MSGFTRKFRVALFTVALAALSIGTVAPVSAQPVLQGLGVAKGCVASTPVGDPYVCLYGFANNPGVNPSNNTITITSVVDTVFASGGNVASGNILPSLSLVFSGTASCTGGSGLGTIANPYVGATSCTIPQDSGILTQAFSFYTVTNADYALPGHVLGDQVSAIWQATCDVTPGCSTQPSQNQAVGQTTITPGNPQIVTSATPTIVAGQTAQDSATISGLLGNAPAGNIVFTLFGPAAAPTCTPANLVFTSGPFPVTANGTFGPATSTALAAPGNYYWIATYTDTNGSNNNVATPCGDTNETTTVQQPDANIQISPLSATNAVNTNHTLTGHVNVSNDGVTFSNAPAGTLITFTKVSGPGSFVGGNTCTTVAATGSCTVQISSAADGTTVVNAETDVTVNTVLLHRETNGTGANSADASKVWVNANIQITPATDTNPVGSNHVLTITINAINGTLDAGSHTATASIESGPGSFVGPNTCTYTGGAATASCTVTISSATTGTTVVSATSAIPVEGQTISRTTNTALNTAAGGSGNASKLWVQPDANIQISPLTATNAVNTNHTLTGHVNVSDDSVTYTNAPAGTLITFSIVSGPGSFVGGNTCLTLLATGSCTVQISSAADGTTVVNAETDVTVNTVLLHRETDGTGANSADASKVWVNANIQITPPTATNPVGTTHVLTITINAINGTLDAGPHTATASIVSGPGSFVGSPSCTYTGGAASATCTVTITSVVAGTTVVSATSAIPVNGQTISRTTNTALNTAAGGSGNASKTWQSLTSGRVTGGGSIFATVNGVPNVRVTHGFQLRCDPTDKRQNLEINWDGGNNFHLTKIINSVVCFDDPTTTPPPPPGTVIDTYAGNTLFNGSAGYHGFGYAVGTGTCNKQPATIYFILIDAGEPGTADIAEYHIVSSGCTLDAGPALIDKGNHQFHKN